METTSGRRNWIAGEKERCTRENKGRDKGTPDEPSTGRHHEDAHAHETRLPTFEHQIGIGVAGLK
ncbi:MAG: hypothetical protein BJ554DRAFT_6040 [Olpidium bornovanus]|uniref:Uncharacterized protein n=1 Tax=Olpidium bornovanus TaxID=278681 RepID=A0A8H7ZYJ4_9FUNG|nr:MAG: hypothetical protein BJ554DRAFT_6040 [Olpidium bornovanus]